MGTELIAQILTGGETQFDNRGSGLYSSLGDFGDCLCPGAAVIGIPHLDFFLKFFYLWLLWHVWSVLLMLLHRCWSGSIKWQELGMGGQAETIHPRPSDIVGQVCVCEWEPASRWLRHV